MTFWRISLFHDLSGKGGLKYSARWHVLGRPIVYLADSPAAALLEICAHTTQEDAPSTFTLLRIAGPDIAAEAVALESLPAQWANQESATQVIGTEWLAESRGALLQVPSALVPETWNFLLNPLHPDAAGFRIERVYEYPFDLRLKG
jgi:RES domain-containing protein